MPARYTPLPNNAHLDPDVDEMEAAFDNSSETGDDVDEADDDAQQRRPLVGAHNIRRSSSGQYDFERVDYDYPPPGSPPRPSALSLSENTAFGNSNGLVPSHPVQRPIRRQRPFIVNWLGQYIPFLSDESTRNRGRIGGGTDNDGVFANIMSKPTRPRRYEDEDGVHIVPEDAIAEVPPSYAAAQADAVPSYWETTIHAPSGGDVPGELIVDSLPTGSLFSFLWSMLVSVAFNFLGFVLTYLLHTTHAAKYGSRAGLGITLIQYGWALRTKSDGLDSFATGLTSDDSDSVPSSSSHLASPLADKGPWRQILGNSTVLDENEFENSFVLGESAAAWLSFSLMTIGWFLFLSSVLGFWRVKRWERGILQSGPSTEQHPVQDITSNHNQGIIGLTFPGLLEGLGINPARQTHEEAGSGERFVVEEIDRQRQIAEVRVIDAQLQRNLRAAGLV